jgi:hypothetical protein
MRRLAVVAASLAAVAGLAACGSPKSTSSSASSTSLPGSPQAASGGAPAPGAGPTSSLPPQCGVSDAWGIAYLKATQAPVPAAEQAAILVSLDEKAAAYKTAVPELATEVTARTDLAKKVLAGTATDADRQAETAAVEKMNTWYGTTCPAAK